MLAVVGLLAMLVAVVDGPAAHAASGTADTGWVATPNGWDVSAWIPANSKITSAQLRFMGNATWAQTCTSSTTLYGVDVPDGYSDSPTFASSWWWSRRFPSYPVNANTSFYSLYNPARTYGFFMATPYWATTSYRTNWQYVSGGTRYPNTGYPGNQTISAYASTFENGLDQGIYAWQGGEAYVGTAADASVSMAQGGATVLRVRLWPQTNYWQTTQTCTTTQTGSTSNIRGVGPGGTYNAGYLAQYQTYTVDISGAVAGTLSGPSGTSLSYRVYSDGGAAPYARLIVSYTDSGPTAGNPTLNVAGGGPAVPGATLVCAPGSGWVASSGTLSFSYAWTRDGVSIPGASGSTLPTAGDDGGRTFRCRVTGTDAAGSASAWSSTLTLLAAPMVNPTVSVRDGGPAVPGVQLDCAANATGEQLTLAYTWLEDGAVVDGATGATYRTAASSAGRNYACRVTATNAAGSSTGTSATLRVHRPPTVVAAIAVAGGGDPAPGATLRCSATADLDGLPQTGAGWSWSRNGTTIAGANDPTYTTGPADDGMSFTCTAMVATAAGAGYGTSPPLTLGSPLLRPT